jgi:hypothetical protein
MREFRELLLEEMLADPIVQALMAADEVEPEELETLLRSVAGPRRVTLCAALASDERR